jgi:hypothetical protein
MNAWMKQWFDETQQANKGGVIRRAVADVDQQTSLDDVIAEAQGRGWHVVETGDQIVVLCHEGAVKLWC